jgi:YVTN family beta-propeller protein
MNLLNVRHQCLVFLALFFAAAASPRSAAQTLAYITNERSNNVSVIDTATDTVKATIPVGSRPFGVSVNEQGTRAYITNSGSGTVSVIDTRTNIVMATIPVGVRPLGVAVSPDGTRAFVANFGSSTVTVIDGTSNRVLATITLGLAAAFGVGVNRQGTKVYVTGEGGQLFVIDAKNNTLENSFLVPCCPFGVAVDQSSVAYIAGMSPGLVSFDMATDSVLTRTQF